MGIGFVILCWVIVGCLTLAVLLSLTYFGRKNGIARSLRKVFIIIFVFIVIPSALMLSWNFAQGFFPGRIYESIFGFAPGPDVKELMGEKSTIGDSGVVYLRFRSSKRTIEKIIESRFVKIEESSFKIQIASAIEASPEYWRPMDDKPTQFYEANRFNDSFGFSKALLSFDDSNGIVNFYWIGVD